MNSFQKYQTMDYIVEAVALGIDAIAFGAAFRMFHFKKSAIKSIEVSSGLCIGIVRIVLMLIVKFILFVILLQNVQYVEGDWRLVDQVASQPNKRLDYVVIRGRVKALSSPIRSLNAWDTFGVVQKFTTKEHLITRHNFGFW